MNALEDPAIDCRAMQQYEFAPIYSFEARDYFDGYDNAGGCAVGDGPSLPLQRKRRSNHIDRENVGAFLARSPEDHNMATVPRYIRYDPQTWGQRADLRHITEHLYGSMSRWISKAAKKYPLLLYAIPKFKRNGERNHQWQRAVLRVHAALCPSEGDVERLTDESISTITGGRDVSFDFRMSSPPPRDLKILTEETLWESYIDIEMIPLGEDHVNGDKIFVSPLPSVPTYNNAIKSFQLSCHDLEEDENDERYVKGRELLDKAKLDTYEFRVKCLPYEPLDSMSVINPKLTSLSDEVTIRLEDGSNINSQISKSLWSNLGHRVDADIRDGGGIYEFTWPAHLKNAESCGRIFTLRDGCSEEGNALLSVGISIRLTIGRGSSWCDNAKPYLHFFNEITGSWTSKDFTLETARSSNTFIVADLQVRRMIFVIGDRNNKHQWIKNNIKENFLIPFAGAYEINTSVGLLKQISGGSLVREVSDYVPYYRLSNSDDSGLTIASGDSSFRSSLQFALLKGEFLKREYEPIDFFKLEDGSCSTEECSLIGEEDIITCDDDDGEIIIMMDVEEE